MCLRQGRILPDLFNRYSNAFPIEIDDEISYADNAVFMSQKNNCIKPTKIIKICGK